MGAKCCNGLSDGPDIVVEPTSEIQSNTVFTQQKEEQAIDVPIAGFDTLAHLIDANTAGPKKVGLAPAVGMKARTATPEEMKMSVTNSSTKSQVDIACCLFWILRSEEQTTIHRERLLKLHQQILSCVHLFKAKVLLDDATSGLIRGFPAQTEDMSAADVMVRMGQILCRWASAEDPPLALLVGVHEGVLNTIPLCNSDGRQGVWGDAVGMARQLVVLNARDRLVHLSEAVRNSLWRLRLLPLVVSPSRESFYLDPTTEVFPESNSKSRSSAQMVRRTRLSFGSGCRTFEEKESLTLDNFITFLQSHGVDVSKFGKLSATTLENFYKAVVIDRVCQLDTVKINDDTTQLERIVVLVRVALRVKDLNGQYRELRLVSESSMKASQPLIVVVCDVDETSEWLPSVQSHFRDAFGIEVPQQTACFKVDTQLCTFKEERSSSDLLPDIITVYKSHNVIIEVSNPSGDGMNKLGLPAFSDFYTEGRGVRNHYSWVPFVKHKEDRLMELLLSNGVEVNEFSPNAFAELYDELYEKEMSSLEYMGKDLVRAIRIIKVEVHADIFGVDHKLAVKAKYQKGVCDDREAGNPITMRLSPSQDWQQGVRHALAVRVGLLPEMQAEHLFVDPMSHVVSEEIAYSRTYPGLKTIYEVNRVCVWIVDAQEGRLSLIGLPGATDFSIMRWEKNTRVEGDGDLILTQWSWVLAHPSKAQQNRRVSHLDPTTVREEVEPSQKRRVPFYQGEAASSSTQKLPRTVEKIAAKVVPTLTGLMKGRSTDWTRAKSAAKRIRDRDYTCKQFFDDIVAAFPELLLYCSSDSVEATTCGRTADDEYQRTIGAFFTLFWLMRYDYGGKESFCFGLDEFWDPRTGAPGSGHYSGHGTESPHPEHEETATSTEWRKRRKFFAECDWPALQKVIIDSGLLLSKDGKHDEDRTLAMLVLLAIHDIMKLTDLQPVVDKGTFNGYKAGEVISDHDVALSFVLTRVPEVLPSFAGLNQKQQESIKFTHCKLEYNMGWLVQAEAPPGALLRTFRKVVIKGKVPASDIAFYFVHWLTDLAGAEPFPLEGSEKFVLKFPRRILEQFIYSFSFIENLSGEATETQIVEDYLEKRWRTDVWGPAPRGSNSIAKMRIACMAQQETDVAINQFNELTPADQMVLGEELALTGCRGQQYERDSLEGTESHRKGPAFLVYYAPALLQKAGKKDPRGALAALAEVLRRARELWPLSTKDVDKSVTIRIDALKEMDIPSILKAEAGAHFVLTKTSSVEAMVKLKPVEDFKGLDWKLNQVLNFASCRKGSLKRRRTQIDEF